MGKPYSVDLRERVVAAVERGGMSCHASAAHFGVGVSTAINWCGACGRPEALRRARWVGTSRSRFRAHRTRLLERTKRDFTLRGLVAELAERGLKVDYRTVWSFVHDEKLSFEKTVVAGERDRPDVARRRAQWVQYQNKVAPERLVFIDETWTKTNMAPLRGWARSAWLKAKVPHGHWKTTTFLAALRHDRIDAPWLLNGPIDGESFLTYVEKGSRPHASSRRHRDHGHLGNVKDVPVDGFWSSDCLSVAALRDVNSLGAFYRPQRRC
ncbi:MAG: Transposase [Bradyrhizobium sp.]|nr:Transposase [Bradyrhizobium sp.]